MKYSFIIPTLDKKKLDGFKLPKDSELIPIVGAKSFFDAWNKGIKKAKGEYLVLTHDDTNYVEFPDVGKHFDLDVGLIGTAGTTVLHKDQPWWFSKERHIGGILSGQIWNTENGGESHSVFGDFGEVVTLDGVCMIISKLLLKDMLPDLLKKDYAQWDFYDQILSLEVKKRGFKIITTPMKIVHKSKGGDKRPSFFDSLDKFKAEYLENKIWRIN
jgi:GT2 family glycosyltransferase